MEWLENGIRIFKLTADDADWLSIIAKKAYLDNYTHLWYDAGAWYAEYCFNVEQLRLELSDENALFFGVEDDKEPLGFLKINIDYPLSKTLCQSKDLTLMTFDTDEIQNALELERIYLTKQGQGRGIGHRLVKVTFDAARSRGKDVVWLKAMDTSPAIDFYERMGFTECCTMNLGYEKMKTELRGMKALKKSIFSD
jgi:diamine N-acetyltransferase